MRLTPLATLAALACASPPAETPPAECQKDSECDPGALCVSGACVVGLLACTVAADCAGRGARCAGGLCLGPGQCATTADCAPWERCNGGVCEPRPCHAAAPCPVSARCLRGRCGASELCPDGRCARRVCPSGLAPQPERCNARDDDCDGSVDEDFPSLGTACAISLGPGRSIEGRFRCRGDERGTVCRPPDPDTPRSERCNGLDDDGNDQVDDGFPLGLPCTVEGAPPCTALGAYACRPDGAGVRCVSDGRFEVGLELCNGLDDDCDGVADEGFGDLGDPCVAGVGPCAAVGTMVCTQDGLGTVCDASTPLGSAELCDGLDNDCDGETDEGFDALGAVCSVTASGCEVAGSWTCAPDGASAFCEHPPLPEGVPADESCDGIDNDCDGAIDEVEDIEGLGAVCGTDTGSCSTGTWACIGGALVCAGAVGPSPGDPCNGLDDDCDGAVDEDLQCLSLGAVCSLDAACFSGTCGFGVCTTSCTDAGTCADGLACLQFSLLSRWCFAACDPFASAPCPDGWFCHQSSLEAGCLPVGDAGYQAPCQVNMDCGSGYCALKKCTAPCSSAAGCPAGSACLTISVVQGGFCAPACATDDDCGGGSCYTSPSGKGCVW